MIFDGHAHLFHPKVISNVKKRTALVDRLGLQTDGAEDRVGRSFLEKELRANGIEGCFILPTAGVQEVSRVNESFYRMVEPSDLLYTAGTLHPGYSDNKQELETFMERNIKGIKMCSFSQKFALDDPKTFELFDLIRHFNITHHSDFFVILDTLYGADGFFGSHPAHNTTPDRLANLVTRFPEINFIGAHMGGLAAPFKDVSTHLDPMENLFLDTSNAAHVLDEDQFIALLKAHGPEHIIFGTDWPWFTHAPEIDLQNRMLKKAGYSPKDADLVFSKNICRLLGLTL
jgi:hypothetical protein